MGYEVYDCDSEARTIMESDAGIKKEIAEKISPDAISPDGTLNRPAIAAIVFRNPEKLCILNSLVHGAVKADISRRAAARQSGVMFVETAILYQSGLDSMVDAVWEVSAPTHIRVDRVMKRNSLTEAQVLERITSQDSYKASRKHPKVYVLTNDNTTPMLPQIEYLISLTETEH